MTLTDLIANPSSPSLRNAQGKVAQTSRGTFKATLGATPPQAGTISLSKAPDEPAAKALTLEDPAKIRRQGLKDQAYKQIMALIERMTTLKQFASDDPRIMARQLVDIVKALKVALKAYVDAGGIPRAMPATPQAAAPVAAPEDAPADASAGPGSEPVEAAAGPVDPVATTELAKTRAIDGETRSQALNAATGEARGSGVYETMRDAVSGSEAAADMTFVKDVRSFVKAIRDLQTKARIQTAIKGPDDETREAFKGIDDGLKEVTDLLNGIDRDIRASSPEAGLFVALWA